VRPDIDELLAAVRWTIEEALLPEVSGPYARFQAMIALDLLDLIHRRWSTLIADLTDDVRDFSTALRACRDDLAGALPPDLSAALEAAAREPLPAAPLPYGELVARANHLAWLVESLLAALPASGPAAGTGAGTAQTTLRAAVKAQVARTAQRQDGLDVRR
jgi:hypothetical protein